MLSLTGQTAYSLAIAGTFIGALLLIWMSLGVGLIGADGDPSNRMYFAVPIVGLAGALIARFRAEGMARTLFAMAGVVALNGLYAVAAGLGMPYSPPLEILGLTAIFAVGFTGAGWLFLLAAKPR